MTAPEWRPIKDAPKDGTVIIGAELYRWKVYKPGAPKYLQGKGRWQRHNGYGWENADPPEFWQPCLDKANAAGAGVLTWRSTDHE